MDSGENLASGLTSEPVCQPGQPLMKLLPEREADGNRLRYFDRAKAGDVLVSHLAIHPPCLDEAGLQSILSLAKATNMRSGMLLARR